MNKYKHFNNMYFLFFRTLHYNYGVNHMYGSSYGYQGMYDPKSWVNLTP